MCVLYLHFIISFYFMSEIILYLNLQAYFPRSPSMGSNVRGVEPVKTTQKSVVSSNLFPQWLTFPETGIHIAGCYVYPENFESLFSFDARYCTMRSSNEAKG
jgi:hypothetical protein